MTVDKRYRIYHHDNEPHEKVHVCHDNGSSWGHVCTAEDEDRAEEISDVLNFRDEVLSAFEALGVEGPFDTVFSGSGELWIKQANSPYIRWRASNDGATERLCTLLNALHAALEGRKDG